MSESNLFVKEVMLTIEQTPIVNENEIMKKSMEVMSNTHLGIVCVINSQKKLLGILTDGDIRRKLLKIQKPFSALFIDDVLEHAILNPITIKPEDSLEYAVKVMGDKQIWDLPVVNQNGALVGLLHLHPAVKSLLKEAH